MSSIRSKVHRRCCEDRVTKLLSVDATGPYGNQRCVTNTLVKAEVGFNASCPDLHCVFCMLVDGHHGQAPSTDIRWLHSMP